MTQLDLSPSPPAAPTGNIEARIRAVLTAHARLPVDAAALAVDADLYQAGMTSHASVNVMLGLESAFEIEFPDAMLRRSVFASVASIRGAIAALAGH